MKTSLNAILKQTKLINRKSIERKYLLEMNLKKKQFLTIPFLCKVVNKPNTPAEKNQIDLELDLTAQDSYSSVIDNEN